VKVLHIIAGNLSGGAARGAYWLHQGLLAQGVDSKIYTTSRTSLNDDTVTTVFVSNKNKVATIIFALIDKLSTIFYRKRKRLIFSTGMVGQNFTNSVEYKEADIIHLHWINDGFVNMRHLSKIINKPVIWTMRDMWPMTGGCHYAMGCEKFKTGCGRCPQLSSNSTMDLSRLVLSYKKKYLSKTIKLVGISDWLSEQAHESEVFKGFDIRTIHNCINTKTFFPVEKRVARELLGINTGKKIVLAGSTSATDFYKGFDKYIDSLKLLDNNMYHLCFFGELDQELVKSTGLDFTSLGYLQDNISMRLAYSCADVYVAPSIMDAFGKTIVESMACGTPVVCFDATGPKDLVTHMKDGYKAVPFKPESLAEGIKWIVFSSDYGMLCENARDNAVLKFDAKNIAETYTQLYKEVLIK